MVASKLSRQILDVDAVLKAIPRPSSPEATRAQAAAVIREAYDKGRDYIHMRFLDRRDAAQAIHQTAQLMDGILRILYTLGARHYAGERVAVVAVGGYGRSEMFPYSDIDLLFLQNNVGKRKGGLAQFMLYGLWDLGLTVGQSVRTIAQTLTLAAQDTTILTNLLDARFLCGDEALFAQFHTRFAKHVKDASAIAFVEAKLAERDARHQRCGDSRYVLEPNLKEGKGGLRDLQTLWWITQYIYGVTALSDLVTLKLLTGKEYKSFIAARDFLWRVRMHTHLIAKRGEERLTFDMQRAVAAAMGYNDDGQARAVERFMRDYFRVARDVGNLTRSVIAVLEADRRRPPRLKLVETLKQDILAPFTLDGERLTVADDDAFHDHPEQLITLFAVAHEHALDIHPRALQLVGRNLALIDFGLRRNARANNAFLAILLSARNPEHTLRLMNEAGVLGRFIPDFGRVMGQMQFDMYHVYTVDEHTIFAIGILHGIETGKYQQEMPIASDIVHLVQSRRVLYLALFAHDIAKGRGGDHSTLGEIVVRKLARRFGFSEHETENCAWLVRQHLLMSRTAFKRDTNDSKTIEDFVALVQSPERLRLLLILTVADIRAVGPTVWNGWKGALLRELYYRAEEKMGASSGSREGSQKELRSEMLALMRDWKPKAVEDYLALGDSSFWHGLDGATHVRIARLLKSLAGSGSHFAMDTQSDRFRAMTDIVLATPDQQGLFSRIAGAIALAGGSVLAAKIFTLKDGTAIEMFHIQDVGGEAFDKPDRLARLAVYMNKAVAGELDIEQEIARTRLTYPSRMDVFKVPPRVFIENKASAHYTVIEVGGRDRIGFLYTVTHVLAELNLTIATAHITTYGERAVDVFYVKDNFGMKIVHESKIKQIREKLEQALSAPAKKDSRHAG